MAVHVGPHHPVMLNKYCRYCKHCDVLIVHQDELENSLVQTFQMRAPELIGNDYLVLGTFDKATWRGRSKVPLTMGRLPKLLHDFKEYLTIKSGPARRTPAEQDSPGTEITAAASDE